MGRAVVREAIANYLTSVGATSQGGNNDIPLLVGVINHPQKQTLDEAFENIEDVNIDTITSDGVTATVETVSPHGLYSGMSVTIAGTSDSDFDANSVPTTVVDATHFTFPCTITGDSTGGYIAVNFDSGAIIFMYLGPSKRGRFAFGGPHDGLKYVVYELVLNCYLRSQSDLAEDADIDNDTFIDDLVTAIEADRMAGTGSPPASPNGDGSGDVWQWGEGPWSGAVDIQIDPQYPVLLSEGLSTTQVYTEVTISVIEVINT